MNPISPDVAERFCKLCGWAYECWVIHKRLFDDNERREATIAKAALFTTRLSIITQEYSLLQICKLHDPAVQKSTINLTIDYIVRFGAWGSDDDRVHGYV